MLETLISLVSGANAAFGLYKNITSVKKSESSSDRYLDTIAVELGRMSLQVERLSECILYLPELEGVKDLSSPQQHYIRNFREAKDYLEPVQQAIGQDIIASGMMPTPSRLLQEMKQSPWEVLIDIRPLRYAIVPTNPALVPILFQDGGTHYLGWTMRGALSSMFGCEYNELWLSDSKQFSRRTNTGFSQKNRTQFDTESEINLSLQEMRNGTTKKLSFNGETFTVRIPPGGEPGNVVRVLGKGLVNSYNQKRGNLYLMLVADDTDDTTSSQKIVVNQGITQETLGVEILGGVMTPIIPQYTSLPTQKSEIFSTAIDGQTNVQIHVLKGNQDLAHKNTSLGNFNLKGILPAPKGVPQIRVTFSINEDGLIFVSAKDLATGNRLSITLSANN